MGARVLTDTTLVRDPATGAPRLLSVGSPLPDWAEGLVGDHLLADGAESASPPPPPPRSGKGSGRDAWVYFAEANGVSVGEDDSREEIIATLEAQGIVEPE